MFDSVVFNEIRQYPDKYYGTKHETKDCGEKLAEVYAKPCIIMER
jgi:hypothetical protein